MVEVSQFDEKDMSCHCNQRTMEWKSRKKV